MTDWEGVAAIDLHCHLVPRQVLERVVLGTDFPFDMSDLHPIASVTDAIADAAARRAILDGNAVRLLARAGYRGAAGKGDSP